MKNIKVNLKKLLMRNMLAIVLLSTPATLTGCGKTADATEEENPTYVWADDKGVVEYTPDASTDEEVKCIHYLDSEGILKTTYVDIQDMNKYICTDTNGVIIYNIVDEKKLNKFINKNHLISIPDNIDELIEATKDNHLAYGYEYFGNEDNAEYTGKVFVTMHYYRTYKISINEKGKCELVEGPIILNMEDWYEEFPYIKVKYDNIFCYDTDNFIDNETYKGNTDSQRKNKGKAKVPEKETR